MANIMPINIPLPQEPIMANYNWTDVASGVGFVTFDLFQTDNSTATEYRISDNVLGGEGSHAPVSSGTVTFTFDSSPLGTPRVMMGTAFALFSQAVWSTGGSGNSASVYAVVSICKWDGTNETVLATQTTSTLSRVSALEAVTRSLGFSIAKTNFKIGEQIRIKVAVTSAISGTGRTRTIWDPLNRDSGGEASITASTNPTYFKINIPFKIDL